MYAWLSRVGHRTRELVSTVFGSPDLGLADASSAPNSFVTVIVSVAFLGRQKQGSGVAPHVPPYEGIKGSSLLQSRK